jgi:hypothetical protein
MAAIRHIPLIPALRIPRTASPANLLHIYYTPLFAPWRFDRENMVPNHIVFPKLMDIYENTPQDVLRWQVIANTAIREVPKAVMRERLRRRVREAFREALKGMGYDRNGRVLQPAPPAGKTAKDLRGTLEIHCRSRAGLDCEFGEIVQFARSALDAVVKSFNQSSAKPGKFSMGGEWWKLGVAEYRPFLRDQQPPGR